MKTTTYAASNVSSSRPLDDAQLGAVTGGNKVRAGTTSTSKGKDQAQFFVVTMENVFISS